ncbi:hypothetical protein DPX16_4526 [Anabarilius grahami]|uniref:Uncharacterized protein n=1 Tax=Anabarilius grahami TaxID=495550 RepID=A0A3N0XGJ2_ANAGA|nr:hypothetical protein DPX16_4526 [Anabarilius grahami]
MRIVSNGVQPYIVQTGVDTDGETQEEVTTFRMKLDVSEWELKLPTKQGESGKEGDKPGGEKREGLTLETPLGFSKCKNKVWRDGGRARDEGRDMSVC